MSDDPLDAHCRVLALVPELVMSDLAGTPMALGDAALVQVDGIEVVLTSRRGQAMGTDLFTQLGCDLPRRRRVVVKSSQHFKAAFAPLAVQIVYASAPGSVTPDLRLLDYRHIQRTKWPIDA